MYDITELNSIEEDKESTFSCISALPKTIGYAKRLSTSDKFD